jgi:hypothetical protein
LAFLLPTLFALQSTTKRNGSCSSHLSGAHLPSPPFIIAKAQGRNSFFALPSLKSEEPGQHALCWLEERFASKDGDLIPLAKRFPQVRHLSIEEQVKPTLD